ncbi:unnamed protein product [Nippostrongylus brasiliensis]|uniref:Uncharacterized protein n=1 Tax=Nippostrongylus brasiliensis TaxID=27835 RepID=A0A0N4Y5B0_NIPBR|nr:unnamed protein product [Nippostrongylus brasiliensis]
MQRSIRGEMEGVSTDDQQLIQLPPSTNYIRKPSSQCYISPVVVVHQNERSCLSNLPSSTSMLEGNSSTRMTAEDQLHLDPRIRLVASPSTTNIQDKPFTIKKQRFVTSQPTRWNITLPRRKSKGVDGDQQLAEGCDVKHRLAYTPTQTVALGCYWKG